MKTADLPFEVRENLLDQVRQQVGKEPYEQMVSELGEDGLLNLCLERSAALAAGKEASGQPGCLAEIASGFASQWWLWIPLLVGAVAGDDAGGGAFLICLGLIAVAWIANALRRSQTRT